MYLLASEKSHRGFIFLSGYQTVIFCDILLVNLIRFSVSVFNAVMYSLFPFLLVESLSAGESML